VLDARSFEDKVSQEDGLRPVDRQGWLGG
jgi:hypothetical protein